MGNWFRKIFGQSNEIASVLPDMVPILEPESSDIPEATAAPIQSVTTAIFRPPVDKASLAAAGLRHGDWVITSKGLATIVGCVGDEVLTQLRKADGHNLVVLNEHDQAVNALYTDSRSAMRRAYIEEVPNHHTRNLDISTHLNQEQYEAHMVLCGYSYKDRDVS